ncbi:hypothetical protein MKX03_036715 [Papaver bracteatum]|nr:hypothetical protein MKX03_036715 [Papaver bracteatum]
MGTRSDCNKSFSLLLGLLFSVLVSKCSAKTTVHIQNDIEGYEVALDIHCMSNDDDLDHHLLHQGDEWHWDFGEAFSHTHFWCECRWYDNWDYNWKNGTFEVFDRSTFHDKYFDFCLDNCHYSARRDGFYLYREDRYEWQKRNDWQLE